MTDSIIKRAASDLLIGFGATLEKTKKADQPAIFDAFAKDMLELIEEAEGDAPALASTSHLTVKQNRVETELPSHSESSGVVKPGQVRTGVTMGITKNLGDFNSARYDCFVETYGEDTAEGRKEARERANTEAESAMIAKQQELAEYLKKQEEG